MGKKDFLDFINKDEKRVDAAHSRKRGLWGYVATAGSIGWMVVLPAFGGAYLGKHLDRMFGSRGYWTLSLMLLGLAGGVYWVWYISFRRNGGGL